MIKQSRKIRDDQVVLFPTIARRDPRGFGWQALIRGCVSRPRPDGLRRRFLWQFMRRALRISMQQADSPTYHQRIADFMNLPRSGARMRIDIGDRSWLVRRRSRLNGHVQALVRLGDHEVSFNPSQSTRPFWTSFTASVFDSRHPSSTGSLCFIPSTGWSIISDIDDTVKHSDVANRRQLIANTFLAPFQAVDGMAQLYREWENAGAAVHYISSSPWQLYTPLYDFLMAEGFPQGSIHLRSLRFRDPSILQLVVGKKRSKKRAMLSLIRWFPQRRFLLIGDAGEKDPELYGALAQRFPAQVAAIYIRELPGRPVSALRMQRAFADVPRDKWDTYQEPSQLCQWVQAKMGECRPITSR